MSYSADTLEFNGVLELLAGEAQTAAGRKAALEIHPISDRKLLEKSHAETAEAEFLKSEKQVEWSFAGLEDVNPLLALLGIRGSVAEPQMLIAAANFCEKAVAARSAIASERENVPNLWQIAVKIDSKLAVVTETIRRHILPGGEVDDSASVELRRIRNEISQQRRRITNLLESRMRAAEDAIRDLIVTVRNDRFVIPVKADFRGKIEGVTHGFSSSGQTAFVEPLEAIEANNELQSLFGAEEREIARILSQLTDLLREQLIQISAASDAVKSLDLIRAKRRFMERFSAIVPVICADQTLELKDARHPLLEESIRNKVIAGEIDGISTIVPISISLDENHPVMIISGANAGGKTVVLKTAGLLSMLAVAGIPVPARAARIPHYSSILADIGDNQSLSANLSTFTSHMTNISRMLEACQLPSLVLLDEVGTGTDPEEGSALGVAIVGEFRRRGAQIIASTHYRALKIYAANNPDVINASVEFDTKTLKPTHRLVTGLAGSSSGLEIAGRFGIPEEVIEAARAMLGATSRQAEEYLEKLREETKNAAALRAALEAEREAVAAKYFELEAESMQREKQRKAEFERSLAAALESFEKSSEALLDSIQEKALKTRLEKDSSAGKAKLKRSLSAKLEEVFPGSNSTIEPTYAAPDEPITVGAEIITPMGIRGKIERIDGQTAEIIAGSLRMRESVTNLRAIQIPAPDIRKNGPASQAFDIDKEVRSEINLIGMTTADAGPILEKFIDEAYLARLPRVRIIHGFGTGALRKFVHNLLQKHELVERFAPAAADDGGNGVTIAELRSE